MILYNKEKFNKLKVKFDGAETINQNFSQAYQDMFVLTMLNGKKNGVFVEIGADDPTFINNSYLLESSFGWRGVSVDISNSSRSAFSSSRRTSNFIFQNALTIDYSKLFKENNFPKQIDYLQIDIEPMINTLNCLKNMPFDEYRFSVITFETDYYDSNSNDETREKVRNESRQILKENGYKLIVEDVENTPGAPFEDWYIDTSIVEDKNYSELFSCESKVPDNFMLY